MEYNPVYVTILVLLIGVLLIWYVFRFVGNKKVVKEKMVDATHLVDILTAHVSFFQRLDPEAQQRFVKRVNYFLATTKISAEKGAEITEEDKVLVAASATIPLFHFDKWSYENLDEVIIYPGTFDERYDTEASDKNILGMVGDGVMHRKMILSLAALRAGFANSAPSNTAIHEFVHLIDKADGEVDGIPEYLIPKSLIEPWLHEMHKTIRLIHQDRSDIRDYAGTNPAEFLAVTSEYFFEKPKLLKEDHPQLYALLDEIYSSEEDTPDA
ncbi:peptidase [Sphingobacterium psychroaquaticum]|uniref:M90 family metallopeptidase n=1 Tax=Sphingobacterium psychroaquaticum TaxID=561061 RepID=UPI00106A881F|nr:M90 family metallopeptidase [Sphingobacterium psychroaquaticum]QBQ42641.1 peptidase [Sphingobacterium psychroaquaticum]